MLSEFKLIEELVQCLAKPNRQVLTGIGDDAAVLLRPQGNLLATVDMLVEGIHFDLSYMKPEEVGHKALAVNLSDIAAMGATPKYALVSLGIRTDLPLTFFHSLYRGISALARSYSIDIVGGNITRSPHQLVIDVTVLGETQGRGIRRSDASKGDLIGITGPTGIATVGRLCLSRLGRKSGERFEKSVRSFLKPTARVAEGLKLAATGSVTSMIDISDGLSSELNHLSKQSKLIFAVDQSALPIAPEVNDLSKILKSDPYEWILHGGEDYELLFTFKPGDLAKIRRALASVGSSLFVIGKVTGKGKGVTIEKKGKTRKLLPGGWDHLRSL